MDIAINMEICTFENITRNNTVHDISQNEAKTTVEKVNNEIVELKVLLQ